MIKTENLTILFVDIAGFTATTSRQSRMENARLLQNFGTTLLPLIKNFKGRLIKTIGDALLITFRSPTDAMLCSMALQDAIHGYNLSASEGEKIHIRVAANLGEVRVTKNDIFGEPVNVASRIEGVAPADEIYLSEAVYMAMNKAEVPAVEVGSKELAGVPHPVRLYNIPRFSTHRLVSENIGGEEQGSELIYPYGGMHYYQTRSGTLSSFLNFIDSRKVANFFISALAVSVVAIAIVVGYHFINKPLSERLAGKQAITNERQLTSIETPIIQQQSKTEEPISLKSGGNEETAQDNEITVTETDSEESVQIPAKIVTKSPIKKTAETTKVTSLASIETSSTKTETVASPKTTETSSTKTETVARQQTTKTATAKTETVASPKTTETSSKKTEPVTSQQTTKTASTKTENVSGEKLLAGKDSSTLTPVTNIISTPEKGPASGPIESDIGETKSDASKKEIGEVISAPLTYAARRDTIDTIDTVDTISTTDAIDTTDILDTTDWDVYKARQAYRQSKITADEYNRIVRALQTGSIPSAAKKETTETIDAKDITQWNLIKARQAYRESKISKDDYNRILKELKIAYDNKIDQLNLDLKSGKISRNEYLEDVRKARLEYQGE